MALDYGDARTGVAISDERGILCGETLVIAEWNEERLVNRIAALAADKGCALVLLGLPLNMDGSEGARAAKCRALADLLTAAGAPEVLGPAPAPVMKLNNRYRYRCLLVGKNDKPTREAVSWLLKWFAGDRANRGMNLFVDCNSME